MMFAVRVRESRVLFDSLLSCFCSFYSEAWMVFLCFRFCILWIIHFMLACRCLIQVEDCSLKFNNVIGVSSVY
jgi:hypothetical protein